MFEPLADGTVEAIGNQARKHNVSFGFGGIARLDEGLLPGRDVLAEHLRLGSHCVILSRTFHHSEGGQSFEEEVKALRKAEVELALRTPQQALADAKRIAAAIEGIAASTAGRQ